MRGLKAQAQDDFTRQITPHPQPPLPLGEGGFSKGNDEQKKGAIFNLAPEQILIEGMGNHKGCPYVGAILGG